jgi:RES domain-containing protein
MTPLPAALGGADFVAWRLDRTKYLPTWDSGEGAFQVGGRWSSPGRRVLYTSLDPATCILELAVHTGFDSLDMVPRALIEIEIKVPSGSVHVVNPAAVPNANWLRPGVVSPNQQRFGDKLLDAHPFVAIPSVVSHKSWNLIVDLSSATGLFLLRAHEQFNLDPRLVPGVIR